MRAPSIDDFDAALERLRADGHDADEIARRATANLAHWAARPAAPWTEADITALADLIGDDL